MTWLPWKVALVLAIALYSTALKDAEFIETGDCENNQVCVYKYTVTQDEVEDDTWMNATVTTTVEVSCDTVGEYAGKAATQFCLSFRDTEVFFTRPDNDSIGSEAGYDSGHRTPEGPANMALSEWFCFVQTEDGKVVAVHHPHSDKPDIVNFKKSIAAAFQSNFKQTENEEEEDPQSKHTSHYRYENQDGNVIVHRSFGSKDVAEYPSRVPPEDIELTKDEHSTYRQGILQHSTGDVHVKVNAQRARVGGTGFRVSTRPDEEETYDGTFHANKLSVNSSYSLDLERCYASPRFAARHRRDTRTNMAKGYVRSTLAAHHDEKSAKVQRIRQLRKAIPSVEETLVMLHRDTTNAKLVSDLQNLLQLESQYGTLQGTTAAIDQVLEYLQKVLDTNDPDEIQMRLVIYSLIAAEGSDLSQQALLLALEQVKDDKERNTLITYIAFIRNPSLAFVSKLEKLIGPDAHSTDPLLLAYGALASTALPNIQEQIVRYLESRLDMVGNDTVTMVHLIHSLSNTGCNSTVQTLLGYLNHTDANVRLAAIGALRKHANRKAVRTAFITMLRQPVILEEEVRAITQTLILGLEHQRLRAIKQSNDGSLLTALISTTLKLNSSDLQQLLIRYISELNTKESKRHLNYLMARITAAAKSRNLQEYDRVRRGSVWNESNSVYDLVASQSARDNDVSEYPYHKAYIWGKTIGVSDLNSQVAAGGFVGVDKDGSHFKLFGKAVVKGNAFGRSATALDAELLIKKEDTEWHGNLNALIAGEVLVNYDRQASLTWTYDWPLYDSSRYTIISFEYPIFIYVGTLDFTIGVYAQLHLDAVTKASVDVISSASAAIVPKATITAEATATASILETIQGGIRVSGSLNYQLEPQISTRVCIPQFKVENCIAVYDEWPSSYVDIYTFYQYQELEWCSGWLGISYPCGFEWGPEYRYDPASERWDLPGSEKTKLWGVCDEELPECNLIPGASSPLPTLSSTVVASINKLVGTYENHLYDDGGKNAWHFVTVTYSEDQLLQWRNAAGVTWTLKLTDDPTELAVGTDCPYYSYGHTICTVVYAADGNTVAALLGPWNERYDRSHIDAVVGSYENHLYDSGGKNDWHYVTVSRDGNNLKWTNQAGVSWTLTPTSDPTQLAVGTDCPYYSHGHTICTVVFDTDGRTVVALLGPWNERYDHEPSQ